MTDQTNGVRPQLYAGVRFSSTLAARWAAFCHLLNWHVVYQNDGAAPEFVLTCPPWMGTVLALVDGQPNGADVVKLAPEPVLARSASFAGRRLAIGEMLWAGGDAGRSTVTIAFLLDPRRRDRCADLVALSPGDQPRPMGLLSGGVYPDAEMTRAQNPLAEKALHLWVRAGRTVGYVPREART